MPITFALGPIAVAVALAACASGPEVGPDDAIVKRVELASLRAAAARVAGLEQRVATLEADLTRLEAARAALADRLLLLDQRAGRAPFRTEELAAVDLVARFVDAQLLESPEGRARKANLGREVRGQRLVVAFWATWCKPCIADDELALLRVMRQELEQQGITFISMAIDGLDKVRAHPRSARFLYPLWQRDHGQLEMLPEEFIRERGLDMPLFLVVTANGRIRWFRTGKLNPTAVRDIVTAAVLAARR